MLTCQHIVCSELNSEGESVGGHEDPSAVVAAGITSVNQSVKTLIATFGEDVEDCFALKDRAFFRAPIHFAMEDFHPVSEDNMVKGST